MKYLFIIFVSLYSLSSFANQEKVLKLYLDADWSNNFSSANAIWQGVQTALNEIDHHMQGYSIEVVKKNHSGNVIRSYRNISDFKLDMDALAIISGIHSPPLIKHRNFINENKLLTLVPWAAGASITRYPSKENWIFRLSIDDAKVGAFLVDYATQKKGCKTPHLLLESTPWGDSNLVNMTKAFALANRQVGQLTRFDWNMESYSAKAKLQRIYELGSDCILMVSNVVEGAEFARAMAAMDTDQKLPIISHWGITGGAFDTMVPNEIRAKIDLSFVQTCFSFLALPPSDFAMKVINDAKALFPEEINSASDIKPPTGFVHGYDLTRLLITALNKLKLTGYAEDNRSIVRQALENLSAPVDGLIKTYVKPFSEFDADDQDAHEALNSRDYCMARYGASNEIRLLGE